MSYFKSVKKDDNGTLTFELHNTDLSFANALRRIMHSEVPKIAIDVNSVTIDENTSMLHNNMWMQRLGYVHINHDVASKYEIDEIKFNLEKENKDDYIVDVLLSDFTTTFRGDVIENLFLYKDALIGKLKLDQKIELYGHLTQNIAKNNDALFSHASGIGYHFKRDEKLLKKMIKEKKLNKEEQEIFLTSEGDRHFIKNEDGTPSVVIFTIETTGSITPNELVKQSMGVLENKLKESSGNYHVQIADCEFKAFDFIFKDEDDTLGNLLQSFMLMNKNVVYCGYIVPHPLDNILLIRVALDKDNDKENVISEFENGIKNAIEFTQTVSKDW